MSIADDFSSGKSAGDENFPVASVLVARRYRAPIKAFYRFVRAADDVADHATLSPEHKLALLDGLEATLLGKSDHDPAAFPLRSELAARDLSPVHAQDLLTAFRLDARKSRYQSWDELMEYCRYSAMPVGRFVLDVHGEDHATWPANDALCAALQIINHLQDCAKDCRELDRVYMPLDILAMHGADVGQLSVPAATPELRAALQAIAARTRDLLPQAADLPRLIRDFRLCAETGTIVALARRLVAVLMRADPLSQRVHLGNGALLSCAAGALVSALFRRRRAGPQRQMAGGLQ